MGINIKKLKGIIPGSSIARFVLYYTDKSKREKASAQLDLFLGNDVSPQLRARHRKGMRKAYVRDEWGFNEYFFYHYWLLSKEGRKSFVCGVEKNRFCEKMNEKGAHQAFDHKRKFYKLFSDYFKREVFCLNSLESDIDGLRDFVARHPRYIVKPESGTTGHCVSLCEGLDLEPIKAILDEYESGVLVEELILQDGAIKDVYPDSVNTLRVTSLLVNGEPHIVGAAIRFGRGGAIIDNASKGGLAGAIDLETGIVTNVCDKLGHSFVVHPDTGVPIVGLQIPEWDSAISLVKELARKVPACRYVGWDIAYSTKGWVLVEGNAGGQMGVLQIPTQKGIRDRLLEIDSTCLSF